MIAINKTVKKHKSIIPSTPAAQTLTGVDSVSKWYGIGKAKVINKLKSVFLSVFRNYGSSEVEYMDDAKHFIARCSCVDNKNSLIIKTH